VGQEHGRNSSSTRPTDARCGYFLQFRIACFEETIMQVHMLTDMFLMRTFPCKSSNRVNVQLKYRDTEPLARSMTIFCVIYTQFSRSFKWLIIYGFIYYPKVCKFGFLTELNYVITNNLVHRYIICPKQICLRNIHLNNNRLLFLSAFIILSWLYSHWV
jgi:hypothetical protein